MTNDGLEIDIRSALLSAEIQHTKIEVFRAVLIALRTFGRNAASALAFSLISTAIAVFFTFSSQYVGSALVAVLIGFCCSRVSLGCYIGFRFAFARATWAIAVLEREQAGRIIPRLRWRDIRPL